MWSSWCASFTTTLRGPRRCSRGPVNTCTRAGGDEAVEQLLRELLVDQRRRPRTPLQAVQARVEDVGVEPVLVRGVAEAAEVPPEPAAVRAREIGDPDARRDPDVRRGTRRARRAASARAGRCPSAARGGSASRAGPSRRSRSRGPRPGAGRRRRAGRRTACRSRASAPRDRRVDRGRGHHVRRIDLHRARARRGGEQRRSATARSRRTASVVLRSAPLPPRRPLLGERAHALVEVLASRSRRRAARPAPPPPPDPARPRPRAARRSRACCRRARAARWRRSRRPARRRGRRPRRRATHLADQAPARAPPGHRRCGR